MSLRLVPTRRTPAPMEHNPYAPPRAELTRKPAEDAGEWRERGEVVPALHGLVWIRDAWLLFWERPWTWTGMFAQMFGYGCLLKSIPFVWMASPFLGPFFSGGVAFTAHRLRQGEDISALDMYEVFRVCFWPLACLGLFALLLDGVLYFLIWTTDGFDHLFGFVSKIPGSSSWQLLARMLLTMGNFGFVVYVTTFLPMSLTAPLAAVDGRSALGALRDGIGGVSRNWAAFLVHCLAFYLLAIVFAGVALAFVLGLFFTSVPHRYFALYLAGTWLLGALIVLFFTGLFTLTAYTATRDIFYEEGCNEEG